MAISLGRTRERKGTMKVWVRASIAETLEPGWVIADGSTIADASSPYNGKPVPDMRGTYPKGHATLSNANFGADTTYFAGGSGIAAGGSSSVNLAHAHGINNAGGHSHGGSTNNAGSTTDSQGNHDHTTNGNVGSGGLVSAGTATRTTFDGNHGHNVNPHAHGIPFDGDHGHSENNALGSVGLDPVNKTLLWIFKIK